MKIGRNDPFPCGSGKKYKQCCMKYVSTENEYEQMRSTVKESGYEEDIADILCNLFRYMKEKQWIGACHATSAALYVALSECGYSPKLCVGEVECGMFLFDHSWIQLDGKIIDLAVSMTLQDGLPVSDPIVFDTNIDSKQKYSYIYGTDNGSGLDAQAKTVIEVPFVIYMDGFQDEKNGLWGVVERISPKYSRLELLKIKYVNVSWEYIKQMRMI